MSQVSTSRTRREARVLAPASFAMLAVALAGCAPPAPSGGSCTHYASAVRTLENVPDCDLRGRHTLINGLPPARPWDHP